MPTYVYRREDGSTFELEQRITEPALISDPETGQRVQRVISGAGLVFKGAGFYLTDYARKSGPAETKTEKGADKPESKAEAATPQASDAKPAEPKPATKE